MSKKLLSWNINGIRAVLKKGFVEIIKDQDPDILCLQEVKATPEQVDFDLENYYVYWNAAERKGYSGTAMLTKDEPQNVWFGLGEKQNKLKDNYGDASQEGRVITADFGSYYLVNVYTPNSKPDLERLNFRYKVWDPAFLGYLEELQQTKPVVFCGDLNVAHKEIDLARPDQNQRSAGFTDEEREGFDNIVATGFIDTFRMFTEEGGHYTYWTYMGNARARNVGWRIDYFCVSPELNTKVENAYILDEIYGSDHCPVGLDIRL